MKKIQELYNNDLLFVFKPEKVKDNVGLIIIKDDVEIKDLEGYQTMHYSEDFESLLTFPLPTKNRRLAQMISFQESWSILENVAYGVLGFSYQDVPYTVGLNHIVKDGRIFFHCAKTGFKLHAEKTRVSYTVIKDLGINAPKATHNHESIMMQGTMETVTDMETKKEVLVEMLKHLTPSHIKQVTDAMATNTNVLELHMDYLSGKRHIR